MTALHQPHCLTSSRSLVGLDFGRRLRVRGPQRRRPCGTGERHHVVERENDGLLIERVFYNTCRVGSVGDTLPAGGEAPGREEDRSVRPDQHPSDRHGGLRHPVELLKGIAGVNPTFMTTDDKACALGELVRAEAQLVELRLRVLADASDLAESTAAKDAAGWLAHHTRTRFADARADLALATALDRERPVLAAGMRDGNVTLAQAQVIRRALEALPARVTPDTVAVAEAKLVAYAEEFGPKDLARLGRRILDVVAPEIAEAAEADRLADLEAHAADKTRMTMRRQGDGTTRISARVSDAAATRFATYLEAFANPRTNHARDVGRRTNEGTGSRSADPAAVPQTPRRSVRCVPRSHRPHPAPDPRRGRHHDHRHHPPGLAQGRARRRGPPRWRPRAGRRPHRRPHHRRPSPRLACTAKILPAVLDGKSLPSTSAARSDSSPRPTQSTPDPRPDCRAEGCDTPGTWCDAHHLDPWHTGGPTDLANAILLCSHHHHRVHDTAHRTDRLPNGDLRFHRRT